MSINTAILINGILDLAIVLAVAATMRFPFTLDRRKDEAAVYTFAAPPRDRPHCASIYETVGGTIFLTVRGPRG